MNHVVWRWSLCASLIAFGGQAFADANRDPVLAATAELIATSNLVANADGELQVKINLGRHQRQQHDFDQAVKTFVSILESDAPDQAKRTGLLELALTAQEAGRPARAVHVMGQYVERFPEDRAVPEVLLREGLLYREMGAYSMALAKFYSVMTTVLNLKLDSSGYYQRLVLQAQTEIAETYYRQHNYPEAVDFFERLLKQDSPELNKTELHLKLIRSLAAAARHEEAVLQTEAYLAARPDDPEVRYWRAVALQELGCKADSVREVLWLLELQEPTPWKQRAGNQIADELYAAGDFADALTVYEALALVDSTPAWQVSVQYQIGLVRERLHQPAQAMAAYTAVAEQGAKLGNEAAPATKTVLDLAAWRKNHLAWQVQAEEAIQTPH